MRDTAQAFVPEQIAAENDFATGPKGASPRVAVLLCTKQGEAFLEQQLDSIERQTHTSWAVYASDDGSQDATPAILHDFKRRVGDHKLTILGGPQMGFVANFLSLVCNPEINADFYAYADQDDIWEKHKLARAVAFLQTVPGSVPAVYCSRTCNVDATNICIGHSPLFTKPPGFANALVQNIGGGNTMVFNQAARRLLRLAGPHVQVATHDWWTYLLVTGCGGRVFYDPAPTVRYRQHGLNLVGAGNGWSAWLYRVRLLFQGRFVKWTDQHLAALRRIEHMLTPQNKSLLAEFAQARQSTVLGRFTSLRRTGVYRQTLFDNLGLMIAIIFRKI